MYDKTIGYALCGSFCTYTKAMAALKRLTEIYRRVIPIFSQASWETDSRFGTAEEHIRRAEELCGAPALHTIAEVEPIGPKKLFGRPGNRAVHRQHLGKTSPRHCRRPRYHGGKKPLKKRKTAASGRIYQRWARRSSGKHRQTVGPKAHLLCSLRAGRSHPEAHKSGGKFRPVARRPGCRAQRASASARSGLGTGMPVITHGTQSQRRAMDHSPIARLTLCRPVV